MVLIATVFPLSIVLVTTAYACLTYEHSPVFERPIQSSIFIFAFSGVLSLLSYRLIPSALLPAFRKLPSPTLPPHKEAGWKDQISAFQNPWRILFTLPVEIRREVLLLATALSIIVELFRLKLSSRQCFELRSYPFWGFLPLSFLCSKYLQGSGGSAQILRNPPTFAHIVQKGEIILSSISCLVLGIACMIARYAILAPRSTYICPASSYAYTLAPWIDFTNLIISCLFLRALENVFGSSSHSTGVYRNRPFFELVGYMFLIASSMLFVYGSLAFIIQPMNWQWVFNFDRSYVLSLFWHSLVLTAFVLAAIEIVINYGVVNLTSLLVFTSAAIIGILRGLEDRGIFAPSDSFVHGTYLFTLTSSALIYFISGGGAAWEENQYFRLKLSKVAFVIIVLSAVFFGWFTRGEHLNLDAHPLWSNIAGASSLIESAALQASKWEKQAQSSQSFHEAISEYRRRYGRHPPPGFDAWYKFAKERDSVIIDDYDGIVMDLEPFWGIDAAEVRLRTAQVISDTFNDVSEIRIRNGKAALGPNFKPTHRWMLDGILSMIKDFSVFLPDMDLAFNLNDEPRVAVPYHTLQYLKKGASRSADEDDRFPASSSSPSLWSPDRDLQWDPLAEIQPSRPFTSKPRINSFSSATVACPPTSKARTSYFWNPQRLCTSCFAPHSTGLFVSNWTVSASPCHQPDLRNLHGFFLSPAAFKTTKMLLPIFSQAKVDGFTDILYPSPWNYIDKAVYAPDETNYPDLPFTQKENTLFWRGGTSEGVSRFGTWKGMSRQRLAHLSSRLTSSTPISRLVPRSDKPGQLTYTTLRPAIDRLPVSLNVSIVAEFARAWDNDGNAQATEFALAPPVDFQRHWNYRYLFDTDGAGFSGRFLPFLQSRSLPFRAGIFRTWYDSRLTAWRHFVPIDIRLHGLVATLEYFAGTRDGGKVGEGRLEGDAVRAEEIAEAGREWAGKALRKEDMEIYMFRLLLEWGRITDDKREEIGLRIPG